MTDMLSADTRILVVDDDPNLLVLLSKMLMRVGVTPTTAENGMQALDLISSQAPFDLLILDLMLPDIDGFEVLSRIRADRSHDDMPVLILSARADVIRQRDIEHIGFKKNLLFREPRDDHLCAMRI